MSDFYGMNSNEGAPISRQISMSLITPHSITGYQNFFRQNSNREDGWMYLKTGLTSAWEKRWFIFDHGVLRHARSPSAEQSEFIKISMDSVIKLRADKKDFQGEEPTILIVTTEAKLFLKLANMDEMRKWLFCFQKSVALVLTHILETPAVSGSTVQFSSVDSQDTYRASRVVSEELNFVHGRQDFLRRNSLFESKTSLNGMGLQRAYTTEDVNNFIDKEKKSTKDLRQLDNTDIDNSSSQERDSDVDDVWRDACGAESPIRPIRNNRNGNDNDNMVNASGSSNSNNSNSWINGNTIKAMISQSPAIPINISSSWRNVEKLSSSYKEPILEASRLENIVKRVSLTPDRLLEDEIANANEILSRGEDDDCIFDFDKTEEDERNAHIHDNHERALSTSSPTPTGGISLIRRDSTENRASLMWQCGYCSNKGPRTSNEDRFVAIANIDDKIGIAENATVGGGMMHTIGYFAVYDGHGGDKAAIYLQENLLENIRSHKSFEDDIVEAIIETCTQTDKDFLEICKIQKIYSGTTALGAFIVGNKLIVFNIGDCQAVLCSNGLAREMNNPHRPGRADEVARVKEANGWITEEKELYMGRLHRMASHLNDPLVLDKAHQVSWVTIHRVCGELAVSRSIGDPDYKNFTPGKKVDAIFSWPDGHNEIFMADLVIPDPEVEIHMISSEDEFLIIASDGLWDVISTSEAVKLARQSLTSHKSPGQAAEELCELALKLGSSDNVTVVIVQLIHNVPISQQILFR